MEVEKKKKEIAEIWCMLNEIEIDTVMRRCIIIIIIFFFFSSIKIRNFSRQAGYKSKVLMNPCTSIGPILLFDTFETIAANRLLDDAR